MSSRRSCLVSGSSVHAFSLSSVHAVSLSSVHALYTRSVRLYTRPLGAQAPRSVASLVLKRHEAAGCHGMYMKYAQSRAEGWKGASLLVVFANV